MRFIDMERLEALEDWPPGRHPHQKLSPEKWRERLCKAEEELRAASDNKARRAVFTRYSDLWSEVKEHFRALSHDKCWYCESSTLRIRGDIDHYRPKARVAGIAHPGYWWLAFDWHNWRFVCTYCNSQIKDLETGTVGGKGDHFPLVEGEARRISDESEYEDYEDLAAEEPLLLDPAERKDPELLTFSRDGLPRPSAPAEGSVAYRRAATSIQLYHLDHSRLVRKRRDIYAQVRKHVLDYQRYWRKWETERDRSAQALAKRAVKALGRMIASDAEYSMTARAYLKEYRNNEPQWQWVDDLLTAS
jgi:uncharacterized protein (TIGR02646 family)